MRALGQHFYLVGIGVVMIIALALVALVFMALTTERDDSDTPTGPRSSIIPVRDALTGCEYLRTPGGGITPRLDREGKQVCR